MPKGKAKVNAKIKKPTKSAEGIDAILNDRGQDYGDFTTQAVISQNLKAIMWNTPGWQRLQPFQKEALEMIQHKIARTLNGNPNKKDTWDDKAGYAKLAADRIK